MFAICPGMVSKILCAIVTLQTQIYTCKKHLTFLLSKNSKNNLFTQICVCFCNIISPLSLLLFSPLIDVFGFTFFLPKNLCPSQNVSVYVNSKIILPSILNKCRFRLFILILNKYLFEL